MRVVLRNVYEARAIKQLENPLDWRVTSYDDTRQVDFDTGKKIPGSGLESFCGLCGSKHEIHVTITNSKTGQHEIVGTSCALKAGVSNAQAAIKKAQDSVKQAAWQEMTKAYEEKVAREWASDGGAKFIHWFKTAAPGKFKDLQELYHSGKLSPQEISANLRYRLQNAAVNVFPPPIALGKVDGYSALGNLQYGTGKYPKLFPIEKLPEFLA